MLHVGTNESVNEPSRVILGKLLGLRKLLKKDSESNVISNLITLADGDKAFMTVMKTNEELHC